MKVNELQNGTRKVELIVKVVTKNKPRTVSAKTDGKRHDVADILVGDETGTITLSLWDDQISQIQEDDVIQISNGYVSEFAGKMQLNIGRYGQLKRLDSKEYDDFDVYLEEVEASSSRGAVEFIKVVDCLRRNRGINLIVRVKTVLEQREVKTKDGKPHLINRFLIGDETASINFDLWDEGDEITEGDVLEIHGAYIREFKNMLNLNLSRAGRYEKVSKEVPEVNTTRNLSEPAS